MKRLLVPLLCLLLTACAVPRIIVHDDPLSDEEHLQLGLSYEKDGELALAEREYRAALPGEPRAWLSLGNLQFRQEKWADAEESYRRAVRVLPEDPEPRNNLAWLLLTRQKDLVEAERLAGEAVAGARTPEERAEFEDTLRQVRAARAGG